MEKLIIGCGYLGERVAQIWRSAGHRVFAMTRSPARARRLNDRGLIAVLGDVTDPATLVKLPTVETILYAVGLDRTSGLTQREVYVNGLNHVLSRLPAHVARFLYVSSTSVYGQDSGEWVDETSECAPTTTNGQVCRDAEHLVWQRFPPAQEMLTHPASGACVLRLAGLYGPGRLIARVESLQAGQPCAGHPGAWLNLIHVDDAAASVAACEQRGTLGETYLVCDDRPSPRGDFYAGLARLVSAPPPVFVDGAPAALNKRCCNHKLHEQLGVVFQYPNWEVGLPQAFEASLRST